MSHPSQDNFWQSQDSQCKDIVFFSFTKLTHWKAMSLCCRVFCHRMQFLLKVFFCRPVSLGLVFSIFQLFYTVFKLLHCFHPFSTVFTVSNRFFLLTFIKPFQLFSTVLHRCYYPRRPRYSVVPVNRIFFIYMFYFLENLLFPFFGHIVCKNIQIKIVVWSQLIFKSLLNIIVYFNCQNSTFAMRLYTSVWKPDRKQNYFETNNAI